MDLLPATKLGAKGFKVKLKAGMKRCPNLAFWEARKTFKDNKAETAYTTF